MPKGGEKDAEYAKNSRSFASRCAYDNRMRRDAGISCYAVAAIQFGKTAAGTPIGTHLCYSAGAGAANHA